MSFIETFLGERFQPLDPELERIWIEDIAHALGNQCRFSGHVREFYSVAEHCVRVSRLLESLGEDEDVQLWGLMHDASEAYLVDIPAPLKKDAFGAEYRRAEDRLMFAVCERFGLPYLEPRSVRLADATLLATEARDLMPFKKEHWCDLNVEPLAERIKPVAPAVAKRLFIERFRDLDGRR